MSSQTLPEQARGLTQPPRRLSSRGMKVTMFKGEWSYIFIPSTYLYGVRRDNFIVKHCKICRTIIDVEFDCCVSTRNKHRV